MEYLLASVGDNVYSVTVVSSNALLVKELSYVEYGDISLTLGKEYNIVDSRDRVDIA